MVVEPPNGLLTSGAGAGVGTRAGLALGPTAGCKEDQGFKKLTH